MSQTRKKVLFLITKGTMGGAQRYVFDLAVSLPTDSYEVSVAVGKDGVLADMLKKEGIKVYTLKNLTRNISLFNDLRTCISLFFILRRDKPDILHINSSKAGLLGAVAGRLAFTPKIIFTAHGWAFNEDRPTWQKKILKVLHGITILLCHKTIAVSEGMKRQMNLPFVQKKMVVVPLGRTVKDMKYKDDARGILETKIQNTSARLIDYHADFWIGTIAELHPIKRLNRAIDAVSSVVKQFPNVRYIIIHDGELRQQLEQQVKDLGLEEHIFFTGTLEEAGRLLPAFDLFILPSKSEAFGYVLIEAGQAGLPVIATNVGGIPDIITNGETGVLVPPDDTPALSYAIQTLIGDEDLRLSLARAHYERAKLFTLEKMVSDTQNVYEK